MFRNASIDMQESKPGCLDAVQRKYQDKEREHDE